VVVSGVVVTGVWKVLKELSVDTVVEEDEASEVVMVVEDDVNSVADTELVEVDCTCSMLVDSVAVELEDIVVVSFRHALDGE
jgi:hypothetical protein